jgi:hypothetical protein
MRKTKPAALAVPAFALLIAAFGIYALRFSHAAAWRLPAEDRPWVERTLDAAAAVSAPNPRRTPANHPSAFVESPRPSLRHAARPSQEWRRQLQCLLRPKDRGRRRGKGAWSSFGPRPIADPL